MKTSDQNSHTNSNGQAQEPDVKIIQLGKARVGGSNNGSVLVLNQNQNVGGNCGQVHSGVHDRVHGGNSQSGTPLGLV